MIKLIDILLEAKKEKPGLWANIRAKRARGEKPAKKGSKAFKKAVKAAKEINKATKKKNIDEVGLADVNYNTIQNLYDTAEDFTRKKIAALTAPRSLRFWRTSKTSDHREAAQKAWQEIADSLRDMNYKEISNVVDKLNILK